jgi:hypothetical protein
MGMAVGPEALLTCGPVIQVRLREAKRARRLDVHCRGGAGVTEPRDLTDLIPNDVRAELAVAVAVLEQHGPAVTEALRQLDQATTAAWQALGPVEPTEDELRLVERTTGIDRGWQAAYRLVSTLEPPGQGRSPA